MYIILIYRSIFYRSGPQNLPFSRSFCTRDDIHMSYCTYLTTNISPLWTAISLVKNTHGLTWKIYLFIFVMNSYWERKLKCLLFLATILDAILDHNAVPLLLQMQHAYTKTTNLAGYFDIRKPLFTDTDRYGVILPNIVQYY